MQGVVSGFRFVNLYDKIRLCQPKEHFSHTRRRELKNLALWPEIPQREEKKLLREEF